MNVTPKKRTRATSGNWRKLFLDAYERCGIISLAAKSAAISVRTVFRDLKRSDVFRRQFEDAKEKAVDALEGAALLRATQGIEEPVWMKDQNGVPIKVDSFRRYSDTLLIFLLKANRPGKYREQVKHEVSGPNGGPVESLVTTVDMGKVRERIAQAVEEETRLEMLVERGTILLPEPGAHLGRNGHNGDDEGGSITS